MDINPVSQDHISGVIFRWNNVLKKSLNYKTPIKFFVEHVKKDYDVFVLLNLQIKKAEGRFT